MVHIKISRDRHRENGSNGVHSKQASCAKAASAAAGGQQDPQQPCARLCNRQQRINHTQAHHDILLWPIQYTLALTAQHTHAHTPSQVETLDALESRCEMHTQ